MSRVSDAFAPDDAVVISAQYGARFFAHGVQRACRALALKVQVGILRCVHIDLLIGGKVTGGSRTVHRSRINETHGEVRPQTPQKEERCH